MRFRETNKDKHERLKKLSKSYFKYLMDCDLADYKKMMLINEIARVSRQIKEIELMNVGQYNQNTKDLRVQVESKLNNK